MTGPGKKRTPDVEEAFQALYGDGFRDLTYEGYEGE